MIKFCLFLRQHKCGQLKAALLYYSEGFSSVFDCIVYLELLMSQTIIATGLVAYCFIHPPAFVDNKDHSKKELSNESKSLF